LLNITIRRDQFIIAKDDDTSSTSVPYMLSIKVKQTNDISFLKSFIKKINYDSTTTV